MFEIKDRGQKPLTWGHMTKTLLLPSLTGSFCAAQFQLTVLEGSLAVKRNIKWQTDTLEDRFSVL